MSKVYRINTKEQTVSCELLKDEYKIFGNRGLVAKFMMDEEMLRYMRRLREGVLISEKKASIDLLKKIGPRGNFLQGRTPKDYREETYLTTPVFNRGACNEDGRTKAGDIKTRAKKVYDQRIESYEC